MRHTTHPMHLTHSMQPTYATYPVHLHRYRDRGLRQVARRGAGRMVLLLAVLGLLSGCRDLADPGLVGEPVPVDRGPIEGQLLGPDGSPLAFAELRFTNDAYETEPSRRLRFNGTTDVKGHFGAPLPRKGLYDISINPAFDALIPPMLMVAISFAEGPVELRYEGSGQQGGIRLPAGFPPLTFETGDLILRHDLARPEGYVGFREAITPNLAADGSIVGYVPDGSYDVQLCLAGRGEIDKIDKRWSTRFTAPSSTAWDLDLQITPFQFELGLPPSVPSGGQINVLVDPDLRIGLSKQSNDIDLGFRLPLQARTFQLWGPVEPTTAMIESADGVGFFMEIVDIDLRSAVQVQVDLADFVLTVIVVDEGGAAVTGAECNVLRATLNAEARSVTDAFGRADFLLDAGNYLLQVFDGATGRNAEAVVDLSSDLQRQIVLR